MRCNPRPIIVRTRNPSLLSFAFHLGYHTCSLRHGICQATTRIGDSLKAKWELASHIQVLWLFIWSIYPASSTTRTAVEEVRMKTPPSGFALNVGNASLKRKRLPFTLVAQHCRQIPVSEADYVLGIGLVGRSSLTLSQSSSLMAFRSLNEVILVQP